MECAPFCPRHSWLIFIQILEDYSSQIGGLTNELAQLQKDWAEWEESKPLVITNGVSR